MFLINPIYVSILALCSALLLVVRYFKNKDLMDLGMAVPRFMFSGVYLWFSLDPNIPVEITRLWGRNLLCLTFAVEVIYRTMCIFHSRKVRHGNK